MLRITAPEPITGRVVGLTFVEGVAEADGPLERPVDLWLRTHGYRVEVAPQITDSDPAPVDVGDFL